MILDEYTKLSDALAVTDADAYTDYSYDTGNVTPKREIGTGVPMCLVFTVMAAATGSTDTTDFMAITSANANLTSPLYLATRRIPNASLTLGTQWVVPLPSGATYRRYVGGKVELGTGDTITVDVNLVPLANVSDQAYYSDAVVFDA